MMSDAVIQILLDERARKRRFTNRNGLIEDPMQEYRDKQLLNVWTDQEKDIFKEKYLQHPKNFGIIKSYLERKSVKDCVQYYYLSKKAQNYRQLLKKNRARTRSTRNQQHSTPTGSTIPVSGITAGFPIIKPEPNGVTTRQQKEQKLDIQPAETVSNGSTVLGNLPCELSNVHLEDPPGLIGTDENIRNEEDGNIPMHLSQSSLQSDFPNQVKKKRKDESKELHMEEMDTSEEDIIVFNGDKGVSHPHPCAICKERVESYLNSRPQGGDGPPILTDEEESGSTTSSCDEGTHPAQNQSNNSDGKDEYDSSATVSAEEGSTLDTEKPSLETPPKTSPTHIDSTLQLTMRPCNNLEPSSGDSHSHQNQMRMLQPSRSHPAQHHSISGHLHSPHGSYQAAISLRESQHPGSPHGPHHSAVSHQTTTAISSPSPSPSSQPHSNPAVSAQSNILHLNAVSQSMPAGGHQQIHSSAIPSHSGMRYPSPDIESHEQMTVKDLMLATIERQLRRNPTPSTGQNQLLNQAGPPPDPSALPTITSILKSQDRTHLPPVSQQHINVNQQQVQNCTTQSPQQVPNIEVQHSLFQSHTLYNGSKMEVRLDKEGRKVDLDKDLDHIFMNIINCDRGCEICVKYMRMLSAHVRRAHSPPPFVFIQDTELDDLLHIRHDPPNPLQSSPTGIGIQSEPLETIEKMECAVEESETKGQLSHPEFESESVNDPDYTPPTSHHLIQNVHCQGLTKTKGSSDSKCYKTKKKNLSSQKQLKCNECDKIFAFKCRLKIHKRIHTGEKPYDCTECEKSFRRKDDLITHTRTHTEETPFKCDVCGNGFWRRAQFNEHKRNHNRERPFKCDVCGKAFWRRAHLNDHRRIHTADRPFTCDVCGKNFKANVTLTVHKRLHTGVKPHRCAVCEESFASSSHLSYHRKKKHQKCDD